MSTGERTFLVLHNGMLYSVTTKVWPRREFVRRMAIAWKCTQKSIDVVGILGKGLEFGAWEYLSGFGYTMRTEGEMGHAAS